MLVKAKTSFAGIVTMFGGEERDIKDEQVVKDLLSCGYVTSLEDNKSDADDSTSDDGFAREDDESHDETSNSEDNGSDVPKQKETKNENKRTAK